MVFDPMHYFYEFDKGEKGIVKREVIRCFIHLSGNILFEAIEVHNEI